MFFVYFFWPTAWLKVSLLSSPDFSSNCIQPPMAAAFHDWQSKKPSKGSHPMGHVKLVMAATMFDVLIKQNLTSETLGPKGGELFPQYVNLSNHAKMYSTLAALEPEIHHCSCRLTKKEDKYIMKIQMTTHSSFQAFSGVLHQILMYGFAAEPQHGCAPKGAHVREIENIVSGRCRSGGA